MINPKADPAFLRFRACALRGRQLLDRHHPDWPNKLAGRRIDMASPRNCVLGLCFGGYPEGRFRLGLTPEQCIAYGFAVSARETGSYYFLDLAWRELLAERLREIRQCAASRAGALA